MTIQSRIRTIPHYPKQGVMFRDITTLLKDAKGFRVTINELVNRYTGLGIQRVAAIESRGFIIGAPLAFQLGVGFVPLRKKGKLPGSTFAQEYQLEYGADSIEVHVDAIEKGERVLVVDDLIATGGTAEAACRLIRRSEGEVVECCFVVDLPELGGTRRLEEQGIRAFSLCQFEGP
jgi:adenine phosphoribosyltransferase